jgi:hypothetical protein
MRGPRRPAIDLDHWLVVSSVDNLEAGRPRCHDCRRTPLFGEQMHVYEDGRTLCDLCRPRRREPPVRSALVRSSAHGGTVRLRAA